MNDLPITPDLVARYLAGRLPEPQAEQFEALCAERPDVLRELEETLRFREGFAVLRDRGVLDALMQPRPWQRRSVQFGIAASLVTVALGMTLWVGRSHPVAPLLGVSPAALQASAGAPFGISGSYRLVVTRNVQGIAAQIVLPAQRAAIEFRVLPDVLTDRGIYRVTLEAVPADRAAVEVGTLAAVHSDAEGLIVFYADSALLVPGSYELVVGPEPALAAGATSRFPLLVRATGGPVDAER